MKFATNQCDPPHLRHVATLPWEMQIQICCRYSAAMKVNANKLAENSYLYLILSNTCDTYAAMEYKSWTQMTFLD